MQISTFDRIYGSLAAGCIADALGAPTEELSLRVIPEIFGGYVTSFFAPLPTAPYARGRKAGQITDDSSQMLMLTELLTRRGASVTPQDVADLLIEWSKNESYFPHFAGPTTRAAIEKLKDGVDPWEVGRAGSIMSQGASNGAAMRVAPAGLLHMGDPEAAARTAFMTSVPSHNTSAGVSGAAAIAAAVAQACVADTTVVEIVRAAKLGARIGEELGRKKGRDVPSPSIEERIDLAAATAVRAESDIETITQIEAVIGVGLPAAEAVPAAIGFFVAAGGDPTVTAQLAANAGGDSDTIGCMAASIAGAYTGIHQVDQELLATINRENDVNVEEIARNFHESLTPANN